MLPNTKRDGAYGKIGGLDTFPWQSHKEEYIKGVEAVADLDDLEEGHYYEDNGILQRSLDELRDEQGR